MKGGGKSGHEGGPAEYSIFPTLQDLYRQSELKEEDFGIGMMMNLSLKGCGIAEWMMKRQNSKV
jgi:hypothetical protein